MRNSHLGIVVGLLTVWLFAGAVGAGGETRAAASSQPSISLDFNQADIRDVLRVLAEVSGMNIVVGPEVRGTVTAKLTDVPWHHALSTILKLHGLAQERQGNIILIAPVEHFIAQRQAEAQARQAARQTGPLVTRLVPVKYRDAEELRAAIEQHLGACASVSTDRRTNTLILTGTPSCLRGR